MKKLLILLTLVLFTGSAYAGSCPMMAKNLDSKIEEAAYMNGASKIDCFFSITLPQVLPSIITGLTLAFARCLAEFGATITFVSNIPGETQTLPLALYTATQIPGTEQAALRLVLISIALAFISVAIAEILAKRANKRIMGNSN